MRGWNRASIGKRKHMDTSYRILIVLFSVAILLLLSPSVTATDPNLHPRLILNELNAVGPEKYLEGYVYSDLHNGILVDDEYVRTCKDRTTQNPMPLDPDYPTEAGIRDGRIQGNLGDWIELIVLEDHLDIRGWELRWAETDKHDTTGVDIWYGNPVIEQGIITFSATGEIWSDLRKGTIITIAEKHDIEVDTDWDESFPPNRNFTDGVPDEDAEVIIEMRSDVSYDPEGGDWWIHVDTRDEIEQPDPLVTTVTNVAGDGPGDFSVGSDNWQCTVLDASLNVDFGPVGEAMPYWGGSGINSREIGKLEADPADMEQQYILGSFNDGSSCTFSLPNLWDASTDPQVQHFSELRGWALKITHMEASPTGVTIEWNDILDFTRNGVVTWYLTDPAYGGISYVVEWSTDHVTWTPIDVGTATSWTDTDVAAFAQKFYRVKVGEPGVAAAAPAEDLLVPQTAPGKRKMPSLPESPLRKEPIRRSGSRTP
jgi:hypothetical protein